MSRTQNIVAGCVDKPKWEQPLNCCDACDDEDAQELFDHFWEGVTEWLFKATCYQFPGYCPAETEPCPPCECGDCYCGCGPWGQIDLSDAFCYDICLDDEGCPCIEFVFPQEEGEPKIITPGDDVFQLRPDLVTVDWCEPFTTNACGQKWPANDWCGTPWTIRAMIGQQPPKMLLDGAARFVCEMVKECQGKQSCLPSGVRSITRRGLQMDVSSEIAETISFDNKGTGVRILDIALRDFGCENLPIRAHFDPLDRTDEDHRRCWTYRGRLKATAPSCAPE